MKIYILAFLLSIGFSVLFGFILIPILKKFKIGQNVLCYVTEHKNKSGTPTMGGLFFVLSTVITYLIFSKGEKFLSSIALLISVSFLIVGFLDDFIKIKFKRNLGLTPLQKTVFMVAISIIASLFAFRNGFNFVFLPFVNKTLYLGVFSIILNVFVFLATVNGANLLDGLDGLLGGSSSIIFLALSGIILLELTNYQSIYLVDSEYKNLALLSIIFAGGLMGYLVFNVKNASVFMGDTGSLSIGGAVASISIFSGNTFYIPFIAFSYVLSVVSVIIQVVYFKKTKKRVFKMAPIHHHYQMKGFSESKISYVYALITLIISLILILCLTR